MYDSMGLLHGRILGPPSVENLYARVVSAEDAHICSVVTTQSDPLISVLRADQLVATIGGTSMNRVLAPDGALLLQVSRLPLTQRYSMRRGPTLSGGLEDVVVWCGLISALCRRLYSIRAANED